MKLLLNGKQDQALLDFFDEAKKDEENKIHLEVLMLFVFTYKKYFYLIS